MSVQLKHYYHDTINEELIHYELFLCEDMSVDDKDKTYKNCKNKRKCCLDELCFGYIQVYLGKHPNLMVTTPVMKCPFGIQNQGSNYNLALQFTNLEEDETMKYFYEWIQWLEFQQMKYLGLNEDQSDLYISQIKYDKNKKYDPNLSVKIPFQYNKFLTDIYCDNNPAVNLFYIQRFSSVQCDLYIDKIWKYNDKFICKWKVKCIYLC